MSPPIYCDSSELAVECQRTAQALGLRVAPEVLPDPLDNRVFDPPVDMPWAVAVTRAPSLAQLVGLAHARPRRGQPPVLACISPEAAAEEARVVAGDLGFVAVPEARPLVAALALLESRAEQPWHASVRKLPAVDRARLVGVLDNASPRQGWLTREHDGLLAWSTEGSAQRLLGEARDVALALQALRHCDRTTPVVTSSVEGVDHESVTDVLFGPARALSDPASKSALLPYGVTIPAEELCASASRAAAEAARMGFPVRIALASPDLRVWDHPDLSVDMVDSAAAVRDVFRTLTAAARNRAPDSRILGVTVSATSEAQALLSASLTPLPRGRVAARIGFADAHGRASDDETLAILPAPMSTVERALSRLRGQSLLLSGSPARRRRSIESIGDILLRVAAFVHDRREEIVSTELRPLALILGGGAEVREACITVSDTFERSMQAPAELR